MDVTTTLIGTVAIAFGIFTIYARSKWPSLLGKLEAMKAHFSSSAGNYVHAIAYAIAPIIIGIIFIISGLAGHALFERVVQRPQGAQSRSL